MSAGQVHLTISQQWAVRTHDSPFSNSSLLSELDFNGVSVLVLSLITSKLIYFDVALKPKFLDNILC